MPFGASSSVVAWHRIGDLLLCIARDILFLPVFRYVDDYFCAERYSHSHASNIYTPCMFVCLRPETMESGMDMFARMVRALLGPTAVSERKLECGRELEVLGILVRFVW